MTDQIAVSQPIW